MIQNAWLMPRIYPGWECHVWLGDDVPLETAGRLFDLNCVLHVLNLGWRQRMFYRLLIHDEPGVERYLIRDADSRISMRERRCVDEWMRTDAILHTIHDHFYHQRPIQGGMFGIWRSKLDLGCSMREFIGNYPAIDKWGRDEEFLEQRLWPKVSHSFFEHGRQHPIPAIENEDPGAFIGEIYDANGQPEHPEHRTMGK